MVVIGETPNFTMFWICFMFLIVIPAFMMALLFFAIFVMVPCAFIVASWYMRIKERKLQRRKKDGPNVAFFHPYANAGGGGERVLWVAVKALLQRYPDANIFIYTVDTAEPQKILDKAQNQFNVKVPPERITFIRLTLGKAIEAERYPYFTLLLQSLGSMVLGLEAFLKFNPDIYIDTTGLAFTYPIFRYLAQCPVGCYTHYPTITAAMMRRVKHRTVAYNNSSLIARNPLFTTMKLVYYTVFGWVPNWGLAQIIRVRDDGCVQRWSGSPRHQDASQTLHSVPNWGLAQIIRVRDDGCVQRWSGSPRHQDASQTLHSIYALVGRCADIVMVNGTWTEDHINEIWNQTFSTYRVYPPCEVGELKKLPSLVKDTDPIRILSVAQFRPEKDHPLMLQAMYELRSLLAKNELLWNKVPDIKLVLVGSCRNAEDEERVKNLKDLAKHLSLEDNVQFVVNASYAHLLQLYQTSSIGLHAMWNEHFGISVVECMAAGLITIAHRSGGPLADIIETSEGSRTGFLAAEPDEYARAILEVIALNPDERKRIVEAARASVDRFSSAEFEKAFLRASEPLFKIE